jgi:hypothetical protein
MSRELARRKEARQEETGNYKLFAFTIKMAKTLHAQPMHLASFRDTFLGC